MLGRKSTVFTLLALGLSSLAFAVPTSGGDHESRHKQLEHKMDKVYTKTVTGSEGARTASARPEHEGYGVFASFDLLYWQGRVGGTEYAVTARSITNTPIALNGDVKSANFKWDWGFKVGLGVNFDHDGWDAALGYTYFKTDASDITTAGSPGGVLFQRGTGGLTATSVSNARTLQGISDFCEKATSHVSLDYDNLFLELGRNYFVSRSLSFRPTVGLQTSWINFKQNVRYTGGTTRASGVFNGPGANTLHMKSKSNYWGLGPRLAVDGKWHLTNGFSVFGNGSAALLYGFFHNHHKNWYSAIPDNLIFLKNNYHRFVPNLNFTLGLAYDQYIYNDKQHIGVSLGYECQYFWRANQTLRIDDQMGARYTSASEDVTFRGITLHIRWDF